MKLITPLVDKFSSFWKNQDDFPAGPVWKMECEKWLEFIQRHGQLERFQSRLTKQNAKRRDEAFAEIKAAYFIETLKGYHIIEWEPKGNGKKIGEFCIDINGNEVFCEVKSPGWESELSEEEKKKGRKSERKYLDRPEVRSLATWEPIRFTIEKAYEKFPSNGPTLLIIVDDLFYPITNVTEMINIALFSKSTTYGGKRGFFVDKEFCNLGGILFLNVEKLIEKKEIEYRNKFQENPNASYPLAWPLQSVISY